MRRWVLFASFTGLATAGCSSHENGDRNSSQVVATVNGTELTAAQFDTRIKQLPGAIDARSSAVQQQVMQSFIDETLVSQAATAADYDKRPAVMRELELARNTILARTYLDGAVPAQDVSSTEMQAYYAANPEFYERRRVYQLTDFSLPLNLPNASDVTTVMHRNGATPDAVVAAAQTSGLQLRPQVGQASSDTLPVQLARGLSLRSVGDTVSYNLLGQAHFTRIDAIANAPLSFGQAQASIEERLKGEKRTAAVTKKLAELRKTAKIEMGGLGERIAAGTAQPKVAKPRNSRADQRQAIEKGASGI